MERYIEEYYDFASKISFFEFIQNEFRKAELPVNEFEEELEQLMSNNKWNITELSNYVKKYPHSFVIFEQIFQLKRFTNAQIIHFVFDIDKLNSNNLNAIYEYMILNLKHDVEFRKIFLSLIDKGLNYDDFISNISKYDRKYLIAMFKFSVSKYVDKVVDRFDILERRIRKSEFEDFSIRFSNYLLDNLQLNETLITLNVKRFLLNKRIPIDTKSLHGNYPKIKITKLLENNGYMNIDSILNKNSVHTLKHDLKQQISISLVGNERIFCTERYVDGIIKIKDNKPKKFDLIIFRNYKPKYLFEMNFYTTAGTKIGINQGEYIDLNNYIQKNFDDFEFYWITDGNYWLTTDGKNRYLNLLQYFKKIFNINTFEEHLKDFK